MKILPMHGVSAMGRKLAGLVASSAAGPLAISLTAAVFHCTRMNECVQQGHGMSTRAGIRAGHFLKMLYPTLSKGDGVDAGLVLLMTLAISMSVNGLQSISTSGAWLGIVPRDSMVHFREEPMCSLLVEGWCNVACFAAVQDFLGKLAKVLVT